METLTGTLTKKNCCNQNKHNYYVIFKLETESNECYTVKGHMHFPPEVNDHIIIEGGEVLPNNTISTAHFGSIRCSLPIQMEAQFERFLNVLKKNKIIHRITNSVRRQYESYCFGTNIF